MREKNKPKQKIPEYDFYIKEKIKIPMVRKKSGNSIIIIIILLLLFQ